MHCPNTGPMTGLLDTPLAPCWLSRSLLCMLQNACTAYLHDTLHSSVASPHLSTPVQVRQCEEEVCAHTGSHPATPWRRMGGCAAGYHCCAMHAAPSAAAPAAHGMSSTYIVGLPGGRAQRECKQHCAGPAAAAAHSRPAAVHSHPLRGQVWPSACDSPYPLAARQRDDTAIASASPPLGRVASA